MKIYIVGKTQAQIFHPGPDVVPYQLPGKAAGSKFQKRHEGGIKEDGYWRERESIPYIGEALIEFAGRLCYESWDMPNPATATSSGYLENIIKQGHESVLEHVSVTFYVEGVSRNLSHELIRHRHLSFSELSQRFVDMSEANYINPPGLRNALEGIPVTEPIAGTIHEDQYNEIHAIVPGSRKQKREAARFGLISAMETKFVVTGNLRAWRDVLKKRDSEHADAEMRLFAKEIKRQLLKEYPDVFKDLNEDGSDSL